MAAAKFYKFPPSQWGLPRRRVPRRRGSGNRAAGNRETGGASRGSARQLPGSAKERVARGVGVFYLGRRQEVGPEGGSGRLEGEHGVAAFSLWPGRNPGPAVGQR